ncbi:hypothetical protein TRAPUB_1404 [Trametes pubescens]|uniref:Phytocyanin domain-containing protein n=1 Tax=Trametes pubescens TaxID=154538 RepID=A0A1M2W7Q1_TRAPU|nr:hypothetical protein TRAPUB_1404 [Trametes pubescens]
MRVLSAFVASSLLAGLAAALPAPQGAALLKRTDSSYGSSDSSSGSYGSSSSGSYGDSSSSSSGSYGDSSSGSSYGSSGSGSSSSGSYGGSSSSSGSYGGSSSGSGSYGGSSGSGSGYDSSMSSSSSDCMSGSCDSSSSSSAYVAQSTMYEATSSALATSTTTSSGSMYTSPSYGSGSSNWGSSGYNDCVQQCIASFGPPPASYTPPSSSSGGSSAGSMGTGATHTVIVAPTQGVLRYVPFAVNASVGDTVMFMWGAKNHTVTKSSQLELCNKTSDAPFASGEQNAPFTFTQVVNSTDPVFYYCGTPGHCQKGMFGIINPPSVYNAASSVSQMMGSAVSNSSDMAAMMAYTDKMTNGSTQAANWGANIDMASMPDWSHSSVLENVMYTRAFLGANRETLKDDGTVDLNSNGAPLSLPTDMSTVNNAVDASPAASAAASTSAAPEAPATSAAGAAAASGSAKPNGAASNVASSALFGVAAIAAAMLAL